MRGPFLGICFGTAIGVLMASCMPAQATQWEVLFNPNPEAAVTGYKIYGSAASGGPYTELKDCGKPELGEILEGNEKAYLHCLVDTVEPVDGEGVETPVDWYLVLTAYGEHPTSESEFSKEVVAARRFSIPVGAGEGEAPFHVRRKVTITVTIE